MLAQFGMTSELTVELRDRCAQPCGADAVRERALAKAFRFRECS